MEASLGVPTATSFRDVPAKLLEVNRRVINGYLGRTRGGKVSFTHIIGYAIVRAIARDDAPDELELRRGRRRQAAGIRTSTWASAWRSTSRSPTAAAACSSPSSRRPTRSTSAAFWGTYEEIIRKVRVEQAHGRRLRRRHVTLTNPGTIGTTQSVPRFMPGQGVIVGVGRLDFPPSSRGADPVMLADRGPRS